MCSVARLFSQAQCNKLLNAAIEAIRFHIVLCLEAQRKGVVIYMRERNYGIDFLRIVAMFMVVMVHVLGYGGIEDNYFGYAGSSFLSILAAPAVNLFALVSGYVGFSEQEKTKKRYARLLELWCEVTFYCLVIQLVAIVLHIESLSATKLIKCFLPITFNAYWYFRAYIAAILVAPVINSAVKSMGNQKIIKLNLFLFLFLVFTVYGQTVSAINDVFQFNFGYSFAWIAYLFFVGASVKKTEFRIRKDAIVWVLMAAIGMAWAWSLLFHAMEWKAYERYWSTYSSPMIFAIAFCMLQIFERMTVPKSMQKRIAALGAVAFDVYLVHMHPVVYSHFWMKIPLLFLDGSPVVFQIFACLLIGMTIFAISAIIGFGRLSIFQLLGVRGKCEKLANLINDKLNLKMYK